MKSSVITLAVTAAAVAALAGCASDRKTAMQDDPTSAPGSSAWASASGPEPGNTIGSAAVNTPGTASGTKSSPGSGAAMAQNWSGVVIAVDPILRQDAAAMGVGMAGAAAAGGVMSNEGSPNDKVYRITMRADDGTTQVVVLDSIPTYKSGDRVRYRDGSVQRE